MCGIFGAAVDGRPLDRVLFQTVSGVLAHRGPDAEGLFFSPDGNLGLGHRRLSVIDLRDIANQPMSTPDGRWTIVYNGEVYNYREVRQELALEGAGPFLTDSDTEVILLAWRQWGPQAVNRFNGMFAFSIWDQQEEELWLCRDRLGIKPLFYSITNGLAFASELKGVLPLLSRKPTVSKHAVKTFLHLGFIPEPGTIFEEISKFPSGHYGRYKNGHLELTAYWHPDRLIQELSSASEEEAIQSFQEGLYSSVRYRMIADVPFGTFLSGGTDSSLVTAIASDLSSQQLKTFSIGFKEAKFDESQFAAKVASCLGTDHTSVMLEEKDAMPLLLEMMATFDEPFADTSAIPTMLVSQLAREKVTVILTGDGGDELFLGYGAHDWAKRLSASLARPVATPVSKLLAHGNSRFKRIGHLFEGAGFESIRDHIFSQEQYFFSNAELARLLKDAYQTEPYSYSDPVDLARQLTAAEKQALFDLKVYLKDDVLTKVDRSSMKYGLECRVPLLDYRLVETALNMPVSLKRRNGERKWILKKILEDYLPKELVYRPKWGFSVPLASWLRGEMFFLIETYLDDDLVDAISVVNKQVVNDLIKRFLKGEDYLYQRLWALIVVHRWMKENQ
ncbi:asparagine synthase (glutamine-hydrolyzing) [uncultured Imperialibacter sp.]|uniref:asparagine synthase (glutamine-hydrolyzing) n=1 Tax=uncultured Imperialibacter sp. TaxID=1672639 RepID=UPI0030DAAF9D|tara:strand:- start:7204 stop:9057 length:1854 start_codon:yes stop_codon:yes gene_type:complete